MGVSGLGRELVAIARTKEVPACNFEDQRRMREDETVKLPRFFIRPSEEHHPPSRSVTTTPACQECAPGRYREGFPA